jgi:photosystem II stability/assembly factor-like uncharacterized protein
MAGTLYLATDNGLAICSREGETWQVVSRTLDRRHVTSVIAREGVILAGTRDGVQRSDDGGQSWRAVNKGLAVRHIRWLAYHPDISDREFVGTEPAGIFLSQDGAESWAELPEVAALRDEFGWMLPYSPEAGCVRGFAFHGPRAYAAVEVGGLLRSDDFGATWSLAPGSDGSPALSGPPEPFIYPDVHDVAVHPSDPDLVFAPTGGGLYHSSNGGETWDMIYDCYCRALWLDPDEPDHLIFGPAERVGAVGRIEETRDGGRTWQMASQGLEVPWAHTMPERFTQIGDELFAVLDDGRVLAAPVATLKWHPVLAEAGRVNAITSPID